MYINNGYIGSWCSRKYNDTCSEYHCDSGYVKSPNNWILTCKEPGKWVGFGGQTNLCLNQACPMYINNGYIGSWCSRKYNDTCSEYYCDSGYVKSPNNWILTCKEPGKWVGFGGQTNLCLKEDQICPEKFKGGYIDSYCSRIRGDLCTFRCNPGFIMNGGWWRRLTCGENGEWREDTNSICIESEQACPMYINNGYIGSWCSRKYNDTCSEYYCDSGYVKSPNNWILTCKEPGKWVGFRGQTNLCLTIFMLENVFFQLETVKYNAYYGEVIPYRHREGERFQYTNVYRNLGDFEGGYIPWRCNNKYNTVCHYQCNPGYVNLAGTDYVICDESGRWVNPERNPPVCVKIRTTSPSVTYLTTSAAISRTTSLSSTSLTREGNVGAIVGIIIGTIIGMILIVATVVWIARRSSVQKSQRRVPGHAGSLCLSPRENPEQRPNANGIGSVSSFEPPSYNGPYVHSFGQQIPTISRSCRYPGPPPSYSETQMTPNEFPPTYKEVVTDPSRFNLYI